MVITCSKVLSLHKVKSKAVTVMGTGELRDVEAYAFLDNNQLLDDSESLSDGCTLLLEITSSTNFC
jgi:hypothetical protein